MSEIIDITDKDIELDYNALMAEATKADLTNNIDEKPRYPKVKVLFRQKYNYRRPIIHQLIDFQITINNNKGYIHFNGQFYFKSIKDAIEENPIAYQKYLIKGKNTYQYLPCTAMIVYKSDSKVKQKYYLVEFTDMEYINDTSNYWYDEDVGGNICLFPTAIMKIFFTILEEHTNWDYVYNRLNI